MIQSGNISDPQCNLSKKTKLLPFSSSWAPFLPLGKFQMQKRQTPMKEPDSMPSKTPLITLPRARLSMPTLPKLTEPYPFTDLSTGHPAIISIQLQTRKKTHPDTHTKAWHFMLIQHN